MASGRGGSIGIGKETAWGTAVAPTAFYNGTESIQEERGRLRESISFGSRALQPADAGRLRITGAVSGVHARPVGLGHLLRAVLGAPVTTGASTPYTHTFVPATTKFSAAAALPPYSITTKRGSLIHRYSGGQLNRLTLNQPKDDALVLDMDWIAKGVADVADTTLVQEQGTRFRFQHLGVERNAVAFPTLESLGITIDNGLETEELLNESDEISGTDFGDSQISIDMTMSFQNLADYADFKANTVRPWEFAWVIDANTSLTVTVPRLNISSFSAPISGPGRLTASVAGQAEFDAAAGYGVQVVLKNSQATY